MLKKFNQMLAVLAALAMLVTSGCYRTVYPTHTDVGNAFPYDDYSSGQETADTADTETAVTQAQTTSGETRGLNTAQTDPVSSDTRPAETTAPTAGNKAKLDLNNEHIERNENLKSDLRYGNFIPYFYNFTDKLTTGMTGFKYLIPIETDLYGIKAQVKDKTRIEARLYNNSIWDITITGSWVESCLDDDSSENDRYFENMLSLDRAVEFDASGLPGFAEKPGIYRFVAVLLTSGVTRRVYSYFFTNIDEVKLCAMSNDEYSRSDTDRIIERRAVIADRIREDNIDPRQEISVTDTIFLSLLALQQSRKVPLRYRALDRNGKDYCNR